jgi:amino acid transporter
VGIASSGLIFLLGLLMSQFTLTGYDASAHMSEETVSAARSGPRGIVGTVLCSFAVGWLYLLSLTFSIQDPANLFSPDSVTGGAYASAQVIWDAFAARWARVELGWVGWLAGARVPCLRLPARGLMESRSAPAHAQVRQRQVQHRAHDRAADGPGGRRWGRPARQRPPPRLPRLVPTMVACLAPQFFCGLASVTSNSRMLYAFSRDGAVPGHRLWHRINPRTQTPVNAVWLCVVCSFLLGLPVLNSTTV